jgi:hypothetical protein
MEEARARGRARVANVAESEDERALLSIGPFKAMRDAASNAMLSIVKIWTGVDDVEAGGLALSAVEVEANFLFARQ